MGYNPANFPPPPKTHYTSPPPPLPSRPGSGKIFTSANAKKWFDKTNHVLESRLAPILQGSVDPKHKPVPDQQQQAQQQQQKQQQVPGAQYQGQYQPAPQLYQPPHLAPQYQGGQATGATPGMPGQDHASQQAGQQRY